MWWRKLWQLYECHSAVQFDVSVTACRVDSSSQPSQHIRLQSLWFVVAIQQHIAFFPPVDGWHKTLLVADRWQLETLAFAHAQNQVFHSVMVSLSAIFLKIIGSRMHSDPKFSYNLVIMMPGKKFRKTFRFASFWERTYGTAFRHVPSQKYPWCHHRKSHNVCFGMQNLCL
jgi:hypothetical protein